MEKEEKSVDVNNSKVKNNETLWVIIYYTFNVMVGYNFVFLYKLNQMILIFYSLLCKLLFLVALYYLHYIYLNKVFLICYWSDINNLYGYTYV